MKQLIIIISFFYTFSLYSQNNPKEFDVTFEVISKVNDDLLVLTDTIIQKYLDCIAFGDPKNESIYIVVSSHKKKDTLNITFRVVNYLYEDQILQENPDFTVIGMYQFKCRKNTYLVLLSSNDKDFIESVFTIDENQKVNYTFPYGYGRTEYMSAYVFQQEKYVIEKINCYYDLFRED